MDIDRNLFWKLLEPEHQKARAFCRKLMANRDDGDDLYQDSLVCALSGIRSLRKIKAIRPWLYKIIINSFKNRCRRPWWKRFVPITADIREMPDNSNMAAMYAARRRLERAFQALNADDRALVVLRELQGWTISELAVLYDKSESNLKVRLFRARRKMRQALIRHFKESEQQTETLKIQSKEKICVVTKPGEDF